MSATRSASRGAAAAEGEVLPQSSPANGRDSGPAGPYTPFEKQVLQLKRAHPGLLLMIETGYKARRAGGGSLLRPPPFPPPR
jgi:DNA mismatch repair protein MSH3